MYLGEMPFCMNSFSVGVRPRYRKSARNPSREIRMVVGAKSDVPLDSIAAAEIRGFGFETRYATPSRIMKRTTIAA